MTTSGSDGNRQILEEASAWLVEFRFGEMDRSERARFMNWLRQSPEHIRAYMEMAGVYARLPTPGSISSEDIELLIERTRSRTNVVPMNGSLSEPQSGAMGSRHPPDWRAPLLLLASIGVVSVCALLIVWLTLMRAPLYATATAENRSIALADGSKVELNARTRVRIDYSDTKRHVELLDGQARFHVAKDPQRPFVVSSAGTQVRAVGTEFDVYLRKSGTTVTVLEGRVAIELPPSSDKQYEATGSATLTDGSATALQLVAGEQVIITPDAVKTSSHPNIAAATSWTRGELEFEDAPLPDVIEEINRYRHVPLVIDAASLQHVRITGLYSSEDTASFVRFLRNQPDLVVTETSTEIRVRLK